MARRSHAAVGKRRHDAGKIVEITLPVEQHVETVVVEESEGGVQAPCMGPSGKNTEGDLADLRGGEGQPPGVKPAAERNRHRTGAVPAHLHHPRFISGERQGGGEPTVAARRVVVHISVCGGPFR